MKKKVIQKKTDFIRQRKHRDKIRDLLRQTDNLAKEEKENLEFLTNKIFFL
jgi:hypothetical protein